jgi:hypothetical protein
MKYTDLNTVRNALFALQFYAKQHDNAYLTDLSNYALRALERIEAECTQSDPSS